MEKEPNRYPETELPNLEGDILVLVGRTGSPLPGYPLPPIPFGCGCYEERGVVTNPECVVHEEKGIFRDDYELVCNCEAMVRDGFHGIVLTGSQHVVEAIDVYAKLYGRRARFFLADRKTETIIECTDTMETIYKSFLRALNKLDADKAKFNALVDKIAESVGAKAAEALRKNPATVCELVKTLKSAVGATDANRASVPNISIFGDGNGMLSICLRAVQFDNAGAVQNENKPQLLS